MSGFSLGGFAYPVSNVIVPQGGPKCVPCTADFSSTTTIDIDGQQIIDTHGIEQLQGVFIDNASNATAFTLTSNTGQRIVVAPNTQGFYPLLVQNPPKLTATSVQGGSNKVGLIFYNVPIMSTVWKSV